MTPAAAWIPIRPPFSQRRSAGGARRRPAFLAIRTRDVSAGAVARAIDLALSLDVGAEGFD